MRKQGLLPKITLFLLIFALSYLGYYFFSHHPTDKNIKTKSMVWIPETNF